MAIAERRHARGSFDLPWMREGGAYYSFTLRDHSYDRRPQIGLENGRLQSGFYGSSLGSLIDLGKLPLEVLASTGRVSGLPAELQALHDLLREPVDLTGEGRGSTLEVYRERLRGAGVDRHTPRAVAGHAYLLRAISPEEFDVLVLLRVLEVEDRRVLLAWRVLEDRPVPGDRELFRLPMRSADVPPPAPDLAALTDAELRAHLQAIGAKGVELVFTRPVAEVGAELPELVGRDDAGVTRVVDSTSLAASFLPVRGGGTYGSFARRSHSYDDEPDIALESGEYRSGFYGANMGMVLPIGDVPLEQAGTTPVSPWRAQARRLLDRPVDHSRPAEALRADLLALQGAWRSESIRALSSPGQTYLVRSILAEEHDLLAAFRVLRRDAHGDVIAWRVLRSWPVERRR